MHLITISSNYIKQKWTDLICLDTFEDIMLTTWALEVSSLPPKYQNSLVTKRTHDLFSWGEKMI